MDKRTINQCLKETVQLYRDKEAITDFGLSYTWGAVYVLTLEMSNMLKQLGIKKGTHVAVWMDNSVRWIVLYFALHNIGAVPVLINVAYKWRELEATFATCDVEYVFYSPKYKDSDHLRTIRQLNLEHLPKFREAFLVDTVAMRVPDREEVLAACDAIDVNNEYVIEKIGDKLKVLSGGDYDKISTSGLCKDRCKYELVNATNRQETLSLTTLLIPWLSVNSIISYTSKNKNNPDNYIINSISFNSNEFIMQIQASKYFCNYI